MLIKLIPSRSQVHRAKDFVVSLFVFSTRRSFHGAPLTWVLFDGMMADVFSRVSRRKAWSREKTRSRDDVAGDARSRLPFSLSGQRGSPATRRAKSLTISAVLTTIYTSANPKHLFFWPREPRAK